MNHIFGFVDPIQIGKIYFVGGAGGFIDDMLGFGMITSIMSGISAARAIINNYDYQTEMTPILKELKKIHEFRTGFNSLDHKSKDLFLAFSHLPPIKLLTYNNPFFRYTQLTVLARIYNYFWRRKKKAIETGL
jgi:flavin-dependent dehydrogenase